MESVVGPPNWNKIKIKELPYYDCTWNFEKFQVIIFLKYKNIDNIAKFLQNQFWIQMPVIKTDQTYQGNNTRYEVI